MADLACRPLAVADDWSRGQSSEALIMRREVKVKRNKTGSKVPSPVQSHIEDLLDEGLEETFPASDSLAVERIQEKLKPTPDKEISVKRAGKTPRGAHERT